MMLLKTPTEITSMRESATILSLVHGVIAAAIRPGISTQALNDLAEKTIHQHGATPSFKGLKGFPAAICASINEEILHGPPSARKLQEGDIVTIDIGVYHRGFHSDSAFTHGVGVLAKELVDLLATTEEALYRGIAQLVVGKKLGDIGHAIQTHVESHGYSIIKSYAGHGIGRSLHEEPLVSNYGNPGQGIAIQEGMVLAIEPIVNLGHDEVYKKGRWTVVSKDHQPACHFEHTVAVVEGKPSILTSFEPIKAAKKEACQPH